MALLHAATLTPSKADLISAWLPVQPWAPADATSVELVGAFRFDDPEGSVGMEVHLVRAAGTVFQVPLTYRDAPLADAEASFVSTIEHSALGTRWVYDGLGDPAFVRMLAAVTLGGAGQAVGLVEYEGRWVVVPPTVHLHGSGQPERVPVDGFVRTSDDDGWAVLRNDQRELRVARRPGTGEPAPINLTATWSGQDDPVVLAEIREFAPT